MVEFLLLEMAQQYCVPVIAKLPGKIAPNQVNTKMVQRYHR